MKLRRSSVPFIGHIASAEGLRPDPAKVEAINRMPKPSDVRAIQRLLGLAQYLAKFLPKLSDITKTLRDLTLKGATWNWTKKHEASFQALKKAVTEAPILEYYSLDKEVTIQCDASQSGLGAALLQNGHPIAFASRALTPTECKYAQIEKEMLAILYACERFDAYIYGRDIVTVESDHKPLESIFQKNLCLAPKRLQRMILRIQNYNLYVVYTKGSALYLADTLS